ncbi:RNA polymerase sigma factor [Sphingobacterium hungaricum]
MKIIAPKDENALLVAIKHGDQKSFESLFNHYSSPFSNYIYRILGDKQQTEDLVQEIFLQIWVERDKLDTILSFKDFLFVRVRNRVYSLLKENAKRNALFNPIDLDSILEVEDELIEKEELEKYYVFLEEQIEKLPPQQKAVFTLSKYQKLKYEEIAQQLNISIETVRKHMYVAHKTLKQQLKTKFGFILFVLIYSSLIIF